MNASLARCFRLSPYNINIDTWYRLCPKPRRRIHFWPLSTRSGTSHMISSYFGSDICALCGSKCKAEGGRSRAAVCQSCSGDEITAIDTAMRRLGSIQIEAMNLARNCSRCSLCYEDSTTFAETRGATATTKQRQGSGGGVVTPLANCICIDCPTTYKRHRLRETELETLALCDVLNVTV